MEVIQQQRAGRSVGHHSESPREGVGVRAALVPEELVLRQTFAQFARGEIHEMAGATAETVDQQRQRSLAGTGRAYEQDG